MIKDYWQSAERISMMMGITERKLREHVHEQRMQGVPILSGDRGYKLAKDYSEIEETIRRIEAHSLSQLEMCRALKKTFLGTQTRMSI